MEIIKEVFQIIGTVALFFFVILAVVTILAFFFLRKKYYHYRELWKDRKNFFTIVIFPFIEWVFNSYMYAESGIRMAPLYHYTPKQFFLTKPEHDCFDALEKAVGNEYHIFPQVKLDKFLDEHTKGQKWTAALRHINQKSVDFLLCDKIYLNPKLAIELDDSTHELPDRITRDHEVERILSDARFPLLRLTHSDISSSELLKQNILSKIA